MDLELGPIHERLRLEGRKSVRLPFVVGKIRRVLWPFIRSYHLMTLEWTSDRLRETASQGADRLRTLRAEMLAVSRQAQECVVMVSEIMERAERGARRVDARVDDLAKTVHERIDQLMHDHLEWTSDRPRETASQGADRLRTLRAEMLAVSRQAQECVVMVSEVMERADHGARRVDSRVDDLAKTVHERIDQLMYDHAARLKALESANGCEHSRLGMAAVTEDGRSGFLLGEALCVVTIFGPMLLRRGDLISEHVFQFGVWDAHILPVIEAAARRGRVAVDAGAHFGTLSCAMAVRFPVVHAFEPNTDSFALLCANAALRPTGRIIAHHLGLYHRETELSLSVAAEQEYAISASEGMEKGYRAIPNVGALSFSPAGSGINVVHAVPLDSLELVDVGLIKVDCQGADGEVILGAVDTIRRCQPILVFEWEDLLSQPHGVRLEQVEETLRGLGYRIEVLARHNTKQADYVAYPNGE